ncbi:MAG: DUF805 domain-containing protein [Planctomycetaceae bacterium]|jgi:uncharacterized membrane protein YhaH (DUF805 family)|nr:DUF805 domain-containing protein [Planctomycetaceae bacterium]
MNEYLTVLQKYAVFHGRARRKEYWMFVLFNTGITFAIGFVSGLLMREQGVTIIVFLLPIPSRDFGLSMGEQSATIVSNIYAFAVLVPGIAVMVRRLHDIGKSGWWLLIVFVPIVGAIVLLIWSIRDSQPGSNQYGLNPKGL